MKESYDFIAGGMHATQTAQAALRVYSLPTSDERRELIEQFEIDTYDLDSALDADETPRLEFGGQLTTIIWKRPKNVSVSEQLRFEVASLGLFIHSGSIVLVTTELQPQFTGREYRNLSGPIDFLLKFLLQTVHHYLGHLKVIKQLTADLESKISASMENRYYLQMLALSESLIYYVDGIEANMAVLSKLRASAQRLDMTPDQTDLLHDIWLDTQQCARQASIYSSVLSGLMDARGTIINNNVNTLLKNLTLISVIFLPLNLIASIGGMSEFSTWTQGVDWHIAYSAMLLGMTLLAWLMWVAVMRILDRNKPRSTFKGFGSRIKAFARRTLNKPK